MRDQIPPPARLGLPYVGQFVDEQPLQGQTGGGEIITIGSAARVEIQMAHRSHCHPPWLKRHELAAADRHCGIIDRFTEYPAGKYHLARSQRALPPNRAGSSARSIRFRAEVCCQRSSPAARIMASNECVAPPDTVSVTLTVWPGSQSGDGSIAIRCRPPGSKDTSLPFWIPTGKASII